MVAEHPLARTVLLMRDYLTAEPTDAQILDALMTTSVTYVASRKNLRNRPAVDALVTAVLLSARSGAHVILEIDDVRLEGFHAPLRGNTLGQALLDVCDDLIPGARATSGSSKSAADVRIVIGDTTWAGAGTLCLRLVGDSWCGQTRPAEAPGEEFANVSSPFGPLTAAGLAAGEVFKAAMRRLRRFAHNTAIFDELFAPVESASVALAPSGTPLPGAKLGHFDCVSGGAIMQAALYALARIPSVSGRGSIYEPEQSESTNLNRYAFLRRSRVPQPKAQDLVHWLRDTGLDLTAVETRFDNQHISTTALVAPSILVGVDHIPSRWFAADVARRRREYWLGIGATTHYSAMASFHVRGLPSARSLHPVDDQGADVIPTVSFVSHWAGLYLASLFARHAAGEPLSPTLQSVFATLLRPDLPSAVWWSPVNGRADQDPSLAEY